MLSCFPEYLATFGNKWWALLFQLSTSIITSVRTERYYFTEQLLELLGGPVSMYN